VAYAFSVLPLVVSVQIISSFSVKDFGARTLKMNRLRRGRKCVGWPRSGPPGSIILSGPTGTSISSSQFRFMYPKRKYFEPSLSSSHPSYAGEIF
jgi:hypothetical protein